MEREQIIKALECHPEEMICAIVENKRTHFVTNATVLSLIKELTEENERLKSEVSVKKKLLVKCSDLVEKIQADTVKKMQERLREAPIKVGLPLFGLQTKGEVEDYANELILQMRDAIDQIAKEMLEGDK